MRRIALFGVVALSVGLVEGARAAELPIWAPPVYQAPTAVPYSWTGFYLGFNAGWGWTGVGDSEFVFRTPGRIDVHPVTVTHGSPVFGGQFGYNYQAGNWVFGIEGTVDGADFQHNRTATIPDHTVTGFLNERQSWLASTSGRVGYAWNYYGPQMLYFIGGIAWTGLQFDGGALANTFTADRIFRGTAFGLGYEWMIAPNWSARAEFVDYMFTSNFLQRTTFNGNTMDTDSIKQTNAVVRIGLSYKFDYWLTPTPTRY